MYLDLSNISPDRIYHLMTQSIVPRPIAWVLSLNEEDKVADLADPLSSQCTAYNLAPFSYFNAVCSDPPLLMLSIGKKPDGTRKDSAVNLLAGRPFVIHIPRREQAAQVTETSRSLDLGDSELASIDAQLVPFDGFSLPRLSDCPVAFGCRLYQSHELGSTPQVVIYAEITHVYIQDELVADLGNGRLKIDALKLNPLARLGGSEYGCMTEIVTVPRPK